MNVVWVTGVSGTGKSSVCEALKEQGHRAIDADWEGFNHWVHRVTGAVVVDRPHSLPPGWLDEFAWRISVQRVAELAGAAGSSVTFLCGSVENEIDVWDYFDHVVCLVADDDTIRQRLATRTTNEFGKQPDELMAVLGWNQVSEDLYRDLGASLIDATRPLADVVGEILALTRRREALDDALPIGSDRCDSSSVAKIKTHPTGEDVTAFLDSVPGERRRTDARAVRSLMERVTGEDAVMWGPSMVGFGSQPYTNTLGTNDWFIVGFSPRKDALTIYGIHDGYAEPDPLLAALGPHTTGKSCVYIKRLDQVDLDVLEQLVGTAWQRSSGAT